MCVGQCKQRKRFRRAPVAPRRGYRQGNGPAARGNARSGKKQKPAQERMEGKARFSSHASLCALGRHITGMRSFQSLYATVQIAQKKVVYQPVDKLVDCAIGLMAGISAVSQINTTVRADMVLCLCFGRLGCAEQSVIQNTLDVCLPENVTQLQKVLMEQLQEHGACVRHNFARKLLELDIDLSGKLAGAKAEGSTKGYFARARNARGRQLVRVLASQYDEIVCQWMVPGNTNSNLVLKDAVERAEAVLGLTLRERQRTLIRADAGFGTDENIEWLLSRGYEVLVKEYSASRSAKTARSVTRWEGTQQPGRDIGIPEAPHVYSRSTVQIVVRKPKKKKVKEANEVQARWSYHVLISTLCGRPAQELVRMYDARGGHPESSFQQDKQGLKLTKHQKKRMDAQQMLVGLAQMAHNLLVWARRWAKDATHECGMAHWGLLRWVRDVLAIPGMVDVGSEGAHIVLRAAHPLSSSFIQAFRPLLVRSGTRLSLGEI